MLQAVKVTDSWRNGIKDEMSLKISSPLATLRVSNPSTGKGVRTARQNITRKENSRPTFLINKM